LGSHEVRQKKLGLIGSAVSWIKTNKQTDTQTNKQRIYIDIDIEEEDGGLTEALVKVSICLWKA